MGLTVYLHIIDQADIAIDDIDALNQETEDSGISEITENLVYRKNDYKGFYRIVSGKLEIATMEDGEMAGYGSGWSNVYSCFNGDSVRVLSEHLTAGKLVLMLDIEGNDNEFYVVTPGKYTYLEKLTLANFPD